MTLDEKFDHVVKVPLYHLKESSQSFHYQGVCSLPERFYYKRICNVPTRHPPHRNYQQVLFNNLFFRGPGEKSHNGFSSSKTYLTDNPSRYRSNGSTLTTSWLACCWYYLGITLLHGRWAWCACCSSSDSTFRTFILYKYSSQSTYKAKEAHTYTQDGQVGLF